MTCHLRRKFRLPNDRSDEHVFAQLRAHLRRLQARHQRDLARGGGHVALPHAYHRKNPGASSEWPWQWLFPSARTFPLCQRE